MNVRCGQCGTEASLSLGRDHNYILLSRDWYAADEAKLRCPKCKNSEIPLELVAEPNDDGPIRVRINRAEIFRPRRA